MKKIITLLFMLFSISITLLSQANMYRANELFIGYKESKQAEITWSPEITKVDILVVLADDEIKIYSSEIQKYYMISVIEENDSQLKMLTVDKNGIQCFFIFGYSKDYNKLYILIEYSDFCWMYSVIPEN
jgi:hypothetical protein